MRIGIFQLLGIAAIFVVTVLVLQYLTFTARIHREAEERVLAALTSHYAPAAVEVVKRQDWYFGGDDFSYGGEICFGIDVREPTGARTRIIAMVVSDSDGGAFELHREYKSFADCTSAFNHG